MFTFAVPGTTRDSIVLSCTSVWDRKRKHLLEELKWNLRWTTYRTATSVKAGKAKNVSDGVEFELRCSDISGYPEYLVRVSFRSSSSAETPERQQCNDVFLPELSASENRNRLHYPLVRYQSFQEDGFWKARCACRNGVVLDIFRKIYTRVRIWIRV